MFSFWGSDVVSHSLGHWSSLRPHLEEMAAFQMLGQTEKWFVGSTLARTLHVHQENWLHLKSVLMGMVSGHSTLLDQQCGPCWAGPSLAPNKAELWSRDGPARVSLDRDDHGPQPLELFPQEWMFLGAALFVQCYSKSHLQGGPGRETNVSWERLGEKTQGTVGWEDSKH